MNHSAQWNGLVKRNAYQKLLGSPVGDKMRKAYRRGRSRGFDQYGLDNPAGQYLEAYAQFFDNSGSKMVMPFLREIVANELFVYGDSNVPIFLQALNRIQLEAIKLGDLDEARRPAQLLTAISANLKDLEFPTLVILISIQFPGEILN